MTEQDKGDLSRAQTEMLAYLAGVIGADVWERWDAQTCRELEKMGLVEIVKARHAPINGAFRQPFFGAKLSASGLAFANADGADQ